MNDAILFIQKLRNDEALCNELNIDSMENIRDIVDKGESIDYNFTSKEYKQAFLQDYFLNWLLHEPKKLEL